AGNADARTNLKNAKQTKGRNRSNPLVLAIVFLISKPINEMHHGGSKLRLSYCRKRYSSFRQKFRTQEKYKHYVRPVATFAFSNRFRSPRGLWCVGPDDDP